MEMMRITRDSCIIFVDRSHQWAVCWIRKFEGVCRAPGLITDPGAEREMRLKLIAQIAGREESGWRRAFRARFEPLEARQLLTATVIEVNTTADGSLYFSARDLIAGETHA